MTTNTDRNFDLLTTAVLRAAVVKINSKYFLAEFSFVFQINQPIEVSQARLESSVFSLERLNPTSLVEVSKSIIL